MAFKLKNLLKEQSRYWNARIEMEKAKKEYEVKRRDKFKNISLFDVCSLPVEKRKELEK